MPSVIRWWTAPIIRGHGTLTIMGHETTQADVVTFGDDLLKRMVQAVEKVRERLQRSTAALAAAGVPYAVVGGNAVAAWVSTARKYGSRTM